MSDKTENYEDQVRKEFESTQGPVESKEATVQNLGKVKFNNYDVKEDPEIQRITKTMDYMNIPLDLLPSQGRFYPENTKISIRAAKVNEIRQFSIIDETSRRDIRDKMTYIVSQCTKIYYGNIPGYYKDILEDDRIVLVLKIRELTFTDNNISIPVPEGACQTPGCHPQKTVEFNSNKLQFLTPDPHIEKYYDSVNRCYKIQTKSFGVITLYPATIGVTSVIADWMDEQNNEGNNVDPALIDILPYIVKSWRGFTGKQVFDKLSEMEGWSIEKFALISRLVEEINIGVDYSITETCAQCGGELKVPITFPDGWRSLFIPTIHDLGGELL